MAGAYVGSSTGSVASGTSLTLEMPSGAQGNLIIANLFLYSGGTYAWNTISGWEKYNKLQLYSDWAVLWKVAGEGEDTTPTFTTTGTASLAGCIHEFSGFQASPLDVASNTAYTTNNSTLQAAGITVANQPVWSIFVGSAYDEGGTQQAGAPNGYTERYDAETQNMMFYCATKEITSNGATGTVSATMGVSTNFKHAWLIAYKLPSSVDASVSAALHAAGVGGCVPTLGSASQVLVVPASLGMSGAANAGASCGSGIIVPATLFGVGAMSAAVVGGVTIPSALASSGSNGLPPEVTGTATSDVATARAEVGLQGIVSAVIVSSSGLDIPATSQGVQAATSAIEAGSVVAPFCSGVEVVSVAALIEASAVLDCPVVLVGVQGGGQASAGDADGGAAPPPQNVAAGAVPTSVSATVSLPLPAALLGAASNPALILGQTEVLAAVAAMAASYLVGTVASDVNVEPESVALPGVASVAPALTSDSGIDASVLAARAAVAVSFASPGIAATATLPLPLASAGHLGYAITTQEICNPPSDFPGAVHTAVNIEALAGDPLVSTDPTHRWIHGKIESTLLAVTTRLLGLAKWGIQYDTAAPVAGTWARGDVVLNSEPSAGGYIGWVCVTAGTPGAWRGFGSIQA